MSIALSSAGGRPQVTKRELCLLLRIAKPTLDAWIDRFPEFPILERGSHGRGYKFDPDAVFAFLDERKSEEQQRRAERDEQLAQLILPLGMVEQTRSTGGPSLDDQLKAERLNDMRIARAARMRELVPANEMRDALSSLFANFNAGLRSFIGQLAREQAWPAPIRLANEQRLTELQHRLVREAAATMGDGSVQAGFDDIDDEPDQRATV